MGKVTIDGKMIQKRSTVSLQVPTIGPSNDHTDGSWDELDIYSGEFFLNSTDKILWMGVGANVQEVRMNRVNGLAKMPQFTVAQVGALTPVNGDYCYITNTGQGFPTVGVYAFENGAWVKL